MAAGPGRALSPRRSASPEGPQVDLDRLYDQAPCGFLTTTPDGQVIGVNATFLRWTGHEADAVLGKPLVQLLTPGGRIYHETHYAPMLRMQGSVHEIAVDLRCRDGARLPVLLNADLVRDARGRPEAVQVAVFDATERRQYERELLAARDAARAAEDRARQLVDVLQQTLIPPVPPAVPGLEVAAAYRPAGDGHEVGGDFYDVFPTGAEEYVVTLGDVSGKGVVAAVVTSLVRNTVRALAVLGHGPGEVLAQLNEVVRTHETDRFCTVVLARLRRTRDGWTVTMAVGGHPPPLLVSASVGAAPIDALGPLVGILPDLHYPETELHLGPGEALLLYTDGVTEARSEEDYFGEERLADTVADLGPTDVRALVDGLTATVVDFQDGLTRDDVAVLAVRVPDQP